MDCKNVLMSEGVVEPLFQLLVHKVTIAKFDLLRDLGTTLSNAAVVTLTNSGLCPLSKEKGST